MASSSTLSLSTRLVFLFPIILFAPSSSAFPSRPANLFKPDSNFSIPTLSKDGTSTYIIHTNNARRPNLASQKDWHSSILKSLANVSILYTYDTAIQGFAAKLSPQEAAKIAKVPGVVGVHQDKCMELHTTRSPGFLGLNQDVGLWPESGFGENVIIGLVDSGIWPESLSFADYYLNPIGPGWKGECQSGTKFDIRNCNNKLIGAKYFVKGFESLFGQVEDEFLSPRDATGHGTHTASIAAGSGVENVNMYGFASGTARGVATNARIAAYKACWVGYCFSSDILAAIEAAIKDGVHVLSISIGAPSDVPYYADVAAIGAFAAAQNNIFVAFSAGNSGPTPYSVVNSAPWATNVGAGSIDRTFPARVTLGNGKVFVGQSLYPEVVHINQTFPLIYLSECSIYDIIPDVVMGKIVVCDQAGVSTGFLVENAGGIGMIGLSVYYRTEGIIATAYTLPALTVGYKEGQEIFSYMNSTNNPVAQLEFNHETDVEKDRATMVSTFSSRGPNNIVPELLKPDLIAPGLNIIGAWSGNKAPSMLDEDGRRVEYNIISGTSTAAPHVAGMAALLRSIHPNWSPAAIRSALMTTSIGHDNQYRSIVSDEAYQLGTPQAFGAGLVNPIMARDPGLVYDLGMQDYINLLCTLDYTPEQILSIVRGPFSCSKFVDGPGELNYPSFSVVFDDATNTRILRRTVTNVAEPPENYTVKVINPRPDKVEISVLPESLEFREVNEKQNYRVTFKSKVAGSSSNSTVDDMEFGYIIWESEGMRGHTVKSPVALAWK